MTKILEEKYSTGFRRWAAAFVDGLVFIPVNYIDRQVQGSVTTELSLFLWLSFVTIFTILYSVLLHYKYGQTFGKMFMNVKVLDLSEQRGLSLGQAILRDIFYIVLSVMNIGYLAISLFFRDNITPESSLSNFDSYVSTISAFWVLIELVSMLTNDKRRAIHDFIAGTVVVKVQETEIEKNEQGVDKS